jgi:glutaredoxin
MRRVTLYTREGCCLCQDALEVLERVRSRNPDAFMIEPRDIETDEALLHKYLERIPVVEIDGTEAFELFVAEPELERRLGIVDCR